VALLKGNTVSMAFVHHDTMTGSGPSAPQPVIVDRSAQRMVITVQWAPPVREALDLAVFRPDGSAAAPDSAEKTPQASIQTFNIKPGDVGPWAVRVKRGINKYIKSVPYTLNALFLERHLDYRLSIDPARAMTGDKLTVRAVVAWDGKPLTGLPGGALRVRIQRPPESLGTILHGARFEDKSTGTTTTPKGDKLAPYDRKVAALTRDGLSKRITPADFATIELKERSRGVYEGTFDQTSIAGSYGFETSLDWDDRRTGHVRRVERLEEVVRVKPDPANTEVKMTRVDPPQSPSPSRRATNSATSSGPGTPRSSRRNSMGKGDSEVPSIATRPARTSSPRPRFRRIGCRMSRSRLEAYRSELASRNHFFRYARLILRRSFSARRKSCDFTFEPVTSCQRITGSS
jgi:hypothetical protein